MKMRPSTCLECIAGEMTGEILDFLGFESTVILYGLLSDKPASGIKVINFIGKAQTIESFILMNYLAKKTLTQYFELILQAESMYQNELKTKINARYGLHQLPEAIEFYMKNQSAGKVILKPSLTKAGEPKTDPINLNKEVMAKL